MKDDFAGDPISGLKWTRKTTEKIARELVSIGIKVGAKTVGRLLKKLGYSLRTNRKNIETGSKSKPGDRARRDQQFRKIKRARNRFAKLGLPIISVDSKKKELVGNFKNNGKTWGKKPLFVNDHDFRSHGVGMAVPYGIYDVEQNRGMVVVGTSRETPAFAVDAIAHWWKQEGRNKYMKADHLLILGDGGGGNSSRSRVWKKDLQEKICNRYGLSITVLHYPPGASKWNPIEHRLFSEISKNWAGVPLQSYETVINYICTTKTSQGMTVRATLNKTVYEKGQKVTAIKMKSIRCKHHKTLPEWNYTINPQSTVGG